jgi:GTP-binding protein Era
MTTQRCGFYAVIGAPNAGKSTLVNALVGAKVSIVTPKVQTTRTRVIGIAMSGDTQLVFVDTPGIFAPRRQLDRAMVRAAWTAVGKVDGNILLVDAARSRHGVPDDEAAAIVARLKREDRRALLVLNKTDIAPRENLLKLAARLDAEGVFDRVFMVSAKTADGVDDVRRFLSRQAPPGPWHYPADQVADLPLRLLAAEITREQLYLQLRDELPYAATVETDDWQDFKNGDVRIAQSVIVARDGQKAIVVGKKGQRIKSLSEAARSELEAVLGCKVHLFLTAVVRENWDEDPEHYRSIGLDFSD